MSISNMSLSNNKLSDYTISQRIFLVAIASLCLPFPITCLAISVAAIYALCKSDIRKNMFGDRSNIPLYILSGLFIVVPLFYQRYLSALAGVGLIIALIFFLFSKVILSIPLFNDGIDLCCLSSTVCFLYAVVQKIILGSEFRATGGLLNANYYGTICELIIILALYRIITNKTHIKKYIIIIAINVIGIFLCDCQSAWISMFAGCICLLFICGYKKQGTILLICAVAFVSFAVCVPGILPRFDNMPQTYSTRMSIWTTAIKGFKDHPIFGQGTLTYMFINQLYNGYKTYHAHSLYLDPLLSYGIVGVSIIISYICILVKRVRLNYRTDCCKKINSLTICVFIAVCIHGFTDISILWIQTGVLVLFILSGVFIKNAQSTK